MPSAAGQGPTQRRLPVAGAGTGASGGLGPLVVGLGSPDRGDDAVGPVVARRIAGLDLPGVRVLAHEDPTDLIVSMTGSSVVVVVDAVLSPGSAPGDLIVLETGEGVAPLPEDAWARTGRGGTHAFGLAAAVELARALRRLPPRVVLVGVAASGFEHGAPLSAGVADAVDRAIAAALEALGADVATSPAG
jgi:hydrogenase maturation protease